MSPHSPSPPAGEGLGRGVAERRVASVDSRLSRDTGAPAPSPTASSVKARKSSYPLPQGERSKRGYTQETLKRAKRLRREMTPQERLLWGQLRDKRLGGFKFRDQQPIGPFIGDFVCQYRKLVVEADGSQHADSDHDAHRDAYLKSRGYKVLRFWNNEITGNLNAVLDLILAALSPPHPSAASRLLPSPSRGEGFVGD
jgi:very-short-patch-repair endonuclease